MITADSALALASRRSFLCFLLCSIKSVTSGLTSLNISQSERPSQTFSAVAHIFDSVTMYKVQTSLDKISDSFVFWGLYLDEKGIDD